MDVPRRMRFGAICAFLYVVVFVAGQVYLGKQDQLPSAGKHTADEQKGIFLAFVHQHSTWLAGAAIPALLGYALLAGVAFGLVPVLGAQRSRAPRIIMAIGLVAILAAALGVIAETVSVTDLANRYASAGTSAAKQAVVHTFSDRTRLYQTLDIIGTEGVALWLGLVGVTLLRLRGYSSVPGWCTVAACLLGGMGFPVLLPWSAGAGVGLWRLSQQELSMVAEPAGMPEAETRAEPVERPSRPPAARGAKARRKRRR